MQIISILDGNGTLYGYKPSKIAALLEAVLNQLKAHGADVIAISAIPDYHNIGADGGVKDIAVFFEDKNHRDYRRWYVYPVLHDQETLHGVETVPMLNLIQEALDTITGEVRSIVFLTDSHSFSGQASGVGGKDGVKNILICYLA